MISCGPGIFVVLFFGLGHFAFATPGSHNYLSANSTDSKVSFSARIEIKEHLGKKQQKKLILRQLQNSTHPMMIAEKVAGWSGFDSIEVTHEEKSARKGYSLVHYELTGSLIVRAGNPGNYPIYLVRDPIGTPLKANAACTGGQEPFWYNWNPHNPDCNLREGVDYEVTEAKVEKLPQRAEVYPEYDRLVDVHGEIVIHALFGPQAYTTVNWQPDEAPPADEGAEQFRKFRGLLEGSGFTGRIWTIKEIQKVFKSLVPLYPRVEEFTKQTPRALIRVRLVYAETSRSWLSFAFHAFLEDALENAAVVLFSGHSGRGQNLDLAGIENQRRIAISPPKDRYQLVHLATCLSNTYFAEQFFRYKKSATDPLGTKNLDFLGYAGNETLFATMARDLFHTVGAVVRWGQDDRPPSFNEMAEWNRNKRAMFGIFGVWDNPSKLAN